jgi:tRNA(Ile)-lysidine synthase
MVEPAGLLARCSFPSDGPVACGVSGGPDSLTLLVLACEAGLEVTAVHVDHGLRAGSADEADVVGAAAARFGARFQRERVSVAPGPNLEARARAARRPALPPGALLGHTADDLAETVLLNVLRGAALDGLAGFDPAVRPIRRLRRTETHALCARLGLEPVVDPTNGDPAFRRNRVRHELLPLVNAIAERDVAPVLARQAALPRDDAELLDLLALAVDPTDAAGLAAAPAPLARRAVRRWLRAGAEDHPPDAATVERVLAVARLERAACDVGGGGEVRRHHGVLELRGPDTLLACPPPRDTPTRTTAPISVRWWWAPRPSRRGCGSWGRRSPRTTPVGSRCSSGCSRARPCS